MHSLSCRIHQPFRCVLSIILAKIDRQRLDCMGLYLIAVSREPAITGYVPS